MVVTADAALAGSVGEADLTAAFAQRVPVPAQLVLSVPPGCGVRVTMWERETLLVGVIVRAAREPR